jgi:hypothetical protein
VQQIFETIGKVYLARLNGDKIKGRDFKMPEDVVSNTTTTTLETVRQPTTNCCGN